MNGNAGRNSTKIRRASADWAQPKQRQKRPPGLAEGRWLGDFEPLSPAERALVECCARGELWAPEEWDGKRPDDATEANRIRADLIRFLVLGGDAQHPVHEHGVLISGARVEEAIDLDQARIELGFTMFDCHFLKPISMQDARIVALNFMRSRLPGLDIQRANVVGNLFLDHVTSDSAFSLAGAEIGGQFSCEGATLRHCDKEGSALGLVLNAEGARITGDVILDNANCEGEVSLSGATIGGQLSCEGAKLRNCDKDGSATGMALKAQGTTVTGGVFLRNAACHGTVSFSSATIGGQLTCIGATLRHCDKDGNANGVALDLQGLNVNGGLIYLPKKVEGRVDFTAASISDLLDSVDSWPDENYVLNGFHYQRLHYDLQYARRIDWLCGQEPWYLTENFAPQPWEQLIKVLRETGHSGEAAEVAIAKQKQRRIAGRVGQRVVNAKFTGLRRALDAGWAWFANAMARGWHDLYGLIAGYGYKPQRIVYLMAAVAMLGSLAFYAGRQQGLIGPSDALVYKYARPEECGTGGDPGKLPWTNPKCTPAEYTTFQPFLYSLDLILPLVDLQQEAEWAPLVLASDGDVLWEGRLLRWLMWFEILFGWTGSLMLVAILGRLVDRD